MSRNANKHGILVLGVDHTARDAMKVKFTGILSMFPRNIGLASLSLARHQANAVELATKVCFSHFDVDSEVLV